MNKGTHQQQGVALITVLLILAIVVVLATQMLGSLHYSIVRSTNIKTNNQAYWYAVSAEEYAKNALTTLIELTEDNINLNQQWAQDFEFPVEGGSIKAKLRDLQSCFNLNAINSPPTSTSSVNNTESPAQLSFQRLLENYIEDSYTVDTLRDSLIDWIDEDSSSSSFGAEDPVYESLSLPYLAANGKMTHSSEFRLLNGIEEGLTSDKLKSLMEVVCVVPESDLKINVNTIGEHNAIVLAAALGQSLQVAKDIISSRPSDGFDEIGDFFALSEVESSNLSEGQRDWFSTTTEYFQLNTVAKFQNSQFKMSTVFKLNEETVTVINREFGGAF